MQYHRHRRAIPAVGLCLAAFLVGGAQAQYAVDQPVDLRVPQSGRLLDANPTQSGARFNYSRPGSPLMLGNLAASGQLGGGFSLRSVSPIGAVTDFGSSLPSATLSGFRQNSVSVANVAIPLGTAPLARPYFDDTQTAYTAGFLTGETLPGMRAQPGLQPLDRRISMTNPKRNLYVRTSLERPELGLATASSIFGLEPPPLPLPTTPSLELPWRSELPAEEREASILDQLPGQQPERTAATGWEPRAAWRDRPEPRTPLEALLRTDADTLTLRSEGGSQPLWTRGWRDQEPQLGLILPEQQPLEEEVTSVSRARAPRVTDPSVLPTYDIFNDMRLALALEQDPGAAWFEEMRLAAKARPELAPTPDVAAAESAPQFIENMLESSLTTFTGLGPSAVNDMMLKAESLLEIGRYFEAADRYEAAHLAAPMNPLPLVGKGHALLAAGNYRSAAYALVQAIEVFPQIARFSFDLESLVGSGEQVDIRRADIMRQLERQESPELRFLLGYIEYHVGDRERGIENLDRAARLDRGNSMISRYPELIRGRARPPMPKYRVPPAPDATPQPPPGDGAPRPRDADVPETLVLPPPDPGNADPGAP
jgi:tetratricopeptide (TPR) repeat protein